MEFSTKNRVLIDMPHVLLDFVWIDLGAAHRMREVMREYWPRVNPEGGFVGVHSSLTNILTRVWLEDMRGHVSSNFQGDGSGSASHYTGQPITGTTSASSDEETNTNPTSSVEDGKDRDKDEPAKVQAERERERMNERFFYNQQGPFQTLSFREPHKMFQNSFSLFQKRGHHFAEPVLTRYP